jgi:hypothetical protein
MDAGLNTKALQLRFAGSNGANSGVLFFEQLSDGEKALAGLYMIRAALATGATRTVLIEVPTKRRISLAWNLNRTLSKLNYRIPTDAVKAHLTSPEVTPGIKTRFKSADLLPISSLPWATVDPNCFSIANFIANSVVNFTVVCPRAIPYKSPSH